MKSTLAAIVLTIVVVLALLVVTEPDSPKSGGNFVPAPSQPLPTFKVQ